MKLMASICSSMFARFTRIFSPMVIVRRLSTPGVVCLAMQRGLIGLLSGSSVATATIMPVVCSTQHLILHTRMLQVDCRDWLGAARSGKSLLCLPPLQSTPCSASLPCLGSRSVLGNRTSVPMLPRGKQLYR